jgi:hypothetical protein
MLLLPEAVDDYVGSENQVGFIETFVEGLDLQACGGLNRVQKGAIIHIFVGLTISRRRSPPSLPSQVEAYL